MAANSDNIPLTQFLGIFAMKECFESPIDCLADSRTVRLVVVIVYRAQFHPGEEKIGGKVLTYFSFNVCLQAPCMMFFQAFLA